MNYRLPILLALLFAALAIAPLADKVPWRTWVGLGGPTTVPPPSLPNRPVNQPPLLPVAGVSIASSQADSPPAQSLIERAVHEAERHRFTSATINQEANLFGEHMIGSGAYWELRQGPIPLSHLDLQTKVAGQDTSVTQVCDGKFLWTYRKLLYGTSLDRIDADLAYAALLKASQTPPKPGESGILPGLGGLARLIRGLASSFQFDTVQRGLDSDVPVWRIQGGWRISLLVKLLPQQRDAILAGKPADLSRLPDHLPDGVVILLGQDDLFPYRIDFCRSFTNSAQASGGGTRSLMTIRFSEVDFHTPIPPGQFIYTPATPDTPDHTKDFIKTLGVEK